MSLEDAITGSSGSFDPEEEDAMSEGCCQQEAQTVNFMQQRNADPITPADARAAKPPIGAELVGIVNRQLEERFTGNAIIITLNQYAPHIGIPQKAVDHLISVFESQGWYVKQLEIADDAYENDEGLGGMSALAEMVNGFTNDLLNDMDVPEGATSGDAESATLVFSSVPFV